MVRLSEPMSMFPHTDPQRVSGKKQGHPFLNSLKEITMYRMVSVVGRNGRIHTVPMTAEQTAFYLRLAELRAVTDPRVTFSTIVAETREKKG